MKEITIALKDLGHSFRSSQALAFMFGIPILMTLLFGFLFGGVGSSDETFTVPQTDVVLVNLDAGHPLAPSFESDGQSFPSMGVMLVNILQNESLEELMHITLNDGASARAAVDAQEVGLAVIIPEGFTAALIGQAQEPAEIEFYQNPELSIGPEICQSIVMGVVDDFSKGALTTETILANLDSQGISLSEADRMTLVQSLTRAAEENPIETQANLTVIPLQAPGEDAPSENLLKTILRSIMGGMMVMYAFYTGAAAAESIIEEQERGTLARMFVSPTPSRTILNGKFLSGFLMILVQVSILLLFGRLVFGINWGSLPLVALFVLGVVALATSFGIFIMSLVDNTRQGGIIYGAVLTFTGMLGISSIFTVGTPAEAAFQFVPLVVPQGWALRTLEYAWRGDGLNTLIFTGAMLALSVAFFLIGNTRFKKRFA